MRNAIYPIINCKTHIVMRKYLAEFFGTMFLALLACGSAVLAGPSIGGLGIGLCFGLVLVCLCYCIGNISGCHVNPAVSFAMLLSNKMSPKDCFFYILFQCAGAIVGAGFLYWFWQMGGENAEVFKFGGTTDASGNILAANVCQPGVRRARARQGRRSRHRPRPRSGEHRRHTGRQLLGQSRPQPWPRRVQPGGMG